MCRTCRPAPACGSTRNCCAAERCSRASTPCGRLAAWLLGRWEDLARTGISRAYTAGSAYAEFQEREKGTLEPGKLADFVLLSRDIMTVPPESIHDSTVLVTVLGGRVVYETAQARRQ